MALWLIGGFFFVMILSAMALDGMHDGMLETKRDWRDFGLFIASLLVIGGGAWGLSGLLWPAQRGTGAVLLFILGVFLVQAVLKVVNKVANQRRLRRNGSFTAQEWCRRTDAVLAEFSTPASAGK